MAEPFNPLAPLVDGPLTEAERALIARAKDTPWTDDLRHALARACVDRCLLIPTYATVETLVATLENAYRVARRDWARYGTPAQTGKQPSDA